MPVSRPILIALAAAVLLLVGFYGLSAMRQSDDAVVVEPAPAPEAEPQTADKPAEPAEPAPKQKQGTDGLEPVLKSEDGVPARLSRALDSRETVLIFFRAPRGADDAATARAVASVRGTGAVVFEETTDRLADYEDVVGGLGIAQAPAIVLIDGNRQARLIEGYVDAKTLRQDVADSR